MWIIIEIILFFILLKIYLKLSQGICKSKANLQNKVVIVTGANSGIGFETAKDFASRNAKVILACRDKDRACSARDKIIKDTGNPNIVYKHLDLTSFRSVRAFAKDITNNETRLDILVNNAGTGKLDNSLTEDGLPIEMQVNHFSPFLLTMLLLPLLKASAPSRIVVVASIMHWLGKVDLIKIHKPANCTFEHMRVYSNGKLCNMLFTKELSRRLSGSRVTANCLHPGAVNTEIFRDKPAVVRYGINLFFKNCWEGAQTSIYLSVAPELENVSGKYFVDCNETRTSGAAQDKELSTKLWELSERIVNCTQNVNDKHLYN